MSSITTHILDTTKGKPAAGIKIDLFEYKHDHWDKLTEAITNNDGRVGKLYEDDIIGKRVFKIKFETGSYFIQQNIENFYPYVEIVFNVNSNEHYHVPLLLNPFGYSTYRGS